MILRIPSIKIKKNSFIFFISLTLLLQACSSSQVADIEGTATFSTMEEVDKDYVFHKVISGDSLWQISIQYYKNPYLWPNIFKQNSESIYDADLILPGQSLIIHGNIPTRDRLKATKHAKSRGLWVVGYREESDKNFLEND